MTSLTCPHCGAVLQAPHSTKADCPKCGRSLGGGGIPVTVETPVEVSATSPGAGIRVEPPARPAAIGRSKSNPMPLVLIGGSLAVLAFVAVAAVILSRPADKPNGQQAGSKNTSPAPAPPRPKAPVAKPPNAVPVADSKQPPKKSPTPDDSPPPAPGKPPANAPAAYKGPWLCDPSWIDESIAAVLTARPSALAKVPLGNQMEPVLTDLLAELGKFRGAQIQRIDMLLTSEASETKQLLEYGASVVQFHQAVGTQLAEAWARKEKRELGGQTLYITSQPARQFAVDIENQKLGMVVLSPSRVLTGRLELLERMLSAKSPNRRLADALTPGDTQHHAAMLLDVARLRTAWQAQLSAEKASPETKRLAAALEHAETAVAHLVMGDAANAGIKLNSSQPKQIEPLLLQAAAAARQPAAAPSPLTKLLARLVPDLSIRSGPNHCSARVGAAGAPTARMLMWLGLDWLTSEPDVPDTPPGAWVRHMSSLGGCSAEYPGNPKESADGAGAGQLGYGFDSEQHFGHHINYDIQWQLLSESDRKWIDQKGAKDFMAAQINAGDDVETTPFGDALSLVITRQFNYQIGISNDESKSKAENSIKLTSTSLWRVVLTKDRVYTVSASATNGPLLDEEQLQRFIDSFRLEKAAPPPAHSISKGLVHYWNFDETRGNMARDAVGGVNWFLQNYEDGDQAWGPGKSGRALTLTKPTHAALSTGKISHRQYSLAFWLRVDEIKSLNPRVIGPIKGKHDWVVVNAENRRGVGFYFDNGRNGVQAPRMPEPGGWQHYCVTVDLDRKRAAVYQDGRAVAAGEFADETPSMPWVLGHNTDGRNHKDTLRGAIDELRIYNRVLSAAEVDSLAGGAGQSPPAPSENAAPLAAVPAGRGMQRLYGVWTIDPNYTMDLNLNRSREASEEASKVLIHPYHLRIVVAPENHISLTWITDKDRRFVGQYKIIRDDGKHVELEVKEAGGEKGKPPGKPVVLRYKFRVFKPEPEDDYPHSAMMERGNDVIQYGLWKFKPPTLDRPQSAALLSLEASGAFRELDDDGQLEGIHIAKLEVTDEMLKHLEQLPKVQFLHLFQANLAPSALPALARVKHLKKLHLNQCELSAKQLAAIRKALPETEIVDQAP